MFWVAWGFTHIPCSISFLLSSWIARILFMVAGGELALLLARGLRKYGVGREAGRILGDVCKAEGPEGAPVLSGKDPLPLSKLTCYSSYSPAFQKGNDDDERNERNSSMFLIDWYLVLSKRVLSPQRWLGFLTAFTRQTVTTYMKVGERTALVWSLQQFKSLQS